MSLDFSSSVPVDVRYLRSTERQRAKWRGASGSVSFTKGQLAELRDLAQAAGKSMRAYVVEKCGLTPSDPNRAARGRSKPPEARKLAIQLRASRMIYSEIKARIREELGVTVAESTIQGWCSKAGVVGNWGGERGRRGTTQFNREMALRLRAEGMTYREIALRVGCHKSTARTLCQAVSPNLSDETQGHAETSQDDR